ncbi:CocE/NonD family hydrolase [Actinomadura sp. SCN-SB]|uniref:CocE/NonD family hydrolase n=1 Tax=Actinomadura sp. SCN-SB TaxID=3373092 RepID=UPI0037515209
MSLAPRMKVLYDLMVPMRDGTALATDVYLPGDGAFPALLQRVPYGRSNPAILNGALDVSRAVRRGYAVVVQDCRGRFGSEGVFTPFAHEAEDGADTIRWITAQDWCAGEVGMFGRSYSGLLQWHTAGEGPPGLAAIAPMFSGADVLHGWLAPQGVLEWGFAVLWSIRHLAPDLLARDGQPLHGLLDMIDDIDEVLFERPGDDRLDRMRERLPFLDDWLDPRRRDDVLAAHAPDPARIDVPVLLIAGWFDLFLSGCLDSYARLGRETARELVIGPWAHGGTGPGVFPERDFGVRASADAARLTDRQLDWFDRWLREEDEPPRPAPAVTYFQTGADRWRHDETWPPRQASALDLYLVPGALEDRPPEATGTVRLRYDEADPVPTVGGPTFLPGLEIAANAGPRDQSRLLGRDDVCRFVTEPLDRELDVAGGVVLTVCARPPLPGMSFCARLVEVSASGRAMLLTEAAARLPGAGGPRLVRLDLGALAHRFAAHSRIGVFLAATGHPRYRRWVTEDVPEAPRTGEIEIVCGDERAPSRLVLPVPKEAE